MATYDITLFLNSLRRQGSFKMVIPNDVRADIPAAEDAYHSRPMKTLFLLHGYIPPFLPSP